MDVNNMQDLIKLLVNAKEELLCSDLFTGPLTMAGINYIRAIEHLNLAILDLKATRLLQ